MTEADVLKAYLAAPSADANGITTQSSFWAALRDARAVTGRDGDTGQVLKPDASRAWIGAIAYLCFLDQVGTAVYDDARGQPSDRSGLLRALVSFTELPQTSRNALWALRNALAHDYSLLNVDPKSPRGDLSHRFQLHAEEGELLDVPADRWDGLLHHAREGQDTVVSLRALGDLAESVASVVIDTHGEGRLRIGLLGGPAEMRARYFMRFRG